MNSANERSLFLLKKAIWVYLLLIIFEGALRKWVLPGLSTPLLVIRDPIALWILFVAWQNGFLPKTIYLTGMIILGALGIITAMLFGHGSLPVAIFGARILMIHFPLLFAIGKILNKEDVLQIGRVLLWISIPMGILIGLQYYSPQSAWVNKSVSGGDGGGGFSGANGFFRPPGTFSFITGNALFFELVAVYVVYFWLHSKLVNIIILSGATVAVLASIPFSISRGLFFTILVIVFFAVIATLKDRKYLGKIITASIVMVIGIALLSQMSTFQTAIDTFLFRFTSANKTEGGIEGTLGDRYFGGMISALAESGEMPFFGYGIGMGTNVGSMLLTGGTSFLISEQEWGRVLGEMGTLMGLGVIFIRLGLCWKMTVNAYKKLSAGDMLPWMLLSLGLLTIPQGQWAQPTNLGFSIMIGGLIIASMRSSTDEHHVQEVSEDDKFINKEDGNNSTLLSVNLKA